MAVEYILLEDGSGHIALEDGSGAILLESSDFAQSLSDTVSVAISDGITAVITSASVVTETFSGGYETAYERHVLHRRRERERELQIAQEAQEAAKDDPLQAELAKYLHDQIAKQAKHDDLLRMQKIVEKQTLDRTLPEKVQRAFVNAQADASFSRLMALEREFIKMQEEEELALLMTLSLL